MNDTDHFVIVLFMDGTTCAPCRTAKTNAMRLSAGLAGSNANASLYYFNCAASSVNRDFCVNEVRLPPSPHSPQLWGWGIGNKTVQSGGSEEGALGGELLYNANEIPPHAALKVFLRSLL